MGYFLTLLIYGHIRFIVAKDLGPCDSKNWVGGNHHERRECDCRG